eukprot:1092782-Amphidinium_carterae.3
MTNLSNQQRHSKLLPDWLNSAFPRAKKPCSTAKAHERGVVTNHSGSPYAQENSWHLNGPV